MLAQQYGRGKDHARSAVPALKRLFIQKRLLYGVERAIAFQPLDGRDLYARRGCDSGLAGSSGGTVNQDSAGAALPFSAAILRACQMDLVAQNGKQGFATRRTNTMFRTIDNQKKIIHPGAPGPTETMEVLLPSEYAGSLPTSTLLDLDKSTVRAPKEG